MRMVLNGGKWVVKILTNGLQITTFFGEKKKKKKNTFFFFMTNLGNVEAVSTARRSVRC